MSIAIIDYGMANLRSVQKGFEQVGVSAQIISSPAEIAAADRIVLPGVGAFQDAVATLREQGVNGVSHCPRENRSTWLTCIPSSSLTRQP